MTKEKLEEKGRAFLANISNDGYVSISFAVGALVERIEKLEIHVMGEK